MQGHHGLTVGIIRVSPRFMDPKFEMTSRAITVYLFIFHLFLFGICVDKATARFKLLHIFQEDFLLVEFYF